jgi:tetratricopeptide (TPR) repeat protein
VSNSDGTAATELWANHIQAAREFLKTNRLEEAERELRRLLREEPNHEQGLILIGAVYLRMGKIPQSERSLYQVLNGSPHNVGAIRWLGRLRRAQSNFVDAIELFERVAQITGNTAELQCEIGLCKQDLGDLVEASKCFTRAIQLDPNSAYGHFNLGRILKLRGEPRQAFEAFKRSATLDPEMLASYVQISELMLSLFNFGESLPILEAGLAAIPDSLVLMVALAANYRKAGQPGKAEALFKKAFALDPDAGAAYAFWLQEEGRFSESIEVLKEWLRIKPVQGHGYYLLANQRCYELNGIPLTEAITPLLKKSSLSDQNRMYLAYGLAKTYDHEKNYERAMGFYDLANSLAFKIHNPRVVFTPNAIEDTLSLFRQVFSAENIASFSKKGSPSQAPIMIVGMIRSGTTLLDQILSSHPNIESAGEQPFWTIEGWKTANHWRRTGIDPEQIEKLGQRYLGALKQSVGQVSRVTDKMPTNSEHLGLISMVLPKSKFIHLRRNPVDTCLSIYTTYFGGATTMAYNQRHIVTAYKGYLRMMEYWREVLPKGQMIEIDYEELVADKEPLLRRILEFCGLDWNVAVLAHEQNQSSVSTPSYWTARQPVNTNSVARWKRYEPWLGELGELIEMSHPKV